MVSVSSETVLTLSLPDSFFCRYLFFLKILPISRSSFSLSFSSEGSDGVYDPRHRIGVTPAPHDGRNDRDFGKAVIDVRSGVG